MIVAVGLLMTTQRLLMTLVSSLLQVVRRSTVPMALLLLYHHSLGCSTCSFLSSSISSRSSRQVPFSLSSTPSLSRRTCSAQKRNYECLFNASVTPSIFLSYPILPIVSCLRLLMTCSSQASDSLPLFPHLAPLEPTRVPLLSHPTLFFSSCF